MKIDLSFITGEKPILLALSGGSDSRFLLHVLLKEREIRPFELHIAHIDHGWREESGREAEELRELAKRLKILFHFRKIAVSGANLEDKCRLLRLSFYDELQREYGFQAVALGHHCDDLAETILKRLLEGSSLGNILAMKEVENLGILTLWRPLLRVRKKEILEAIDDYFDDPTNRSEKFLRGRMREKIFPMLSELFGKEVTWPLVRLGCRLDEIALYMDERVEPIWKKRDGSCLDCDGVESRVELRHLIRKMASQMGVGVSVAICETLVKWILEKKKRKLVCKDHAWTVKSSQLWFQKLSGVGDEVQGPTAVNSTSTF